MSVAVRAAALAAALLSTACGDRSDVAPAPNQWRVEPEMVLRLEHRRDNNLPAVADLDVGKDTLLYALHPREGFVRIIDTRGAIRKVIGFSEPMQSPTAFGLLNERLWIYEEKLGSIAVYDAGGAALQERLALHWPALAAGDTARLIALLPDGSPLLLTEGKVPPEPDSTEPAFLLRLPAAPAPADTLFRLREPNNRLLLVNPDTPDSALALSQPFAARSFVAVSPFDGMIVVLEHTEERQDTLRLTKINLIGDTLFSKPVPYRRVRLSRRRIDSEVQRLNQELQNYPAFAAAPERERTDWIRAALRQPRYLPGATGLVVASDGSILVRGADLNADSVNWMVFSRTGDYVADQTTPATTRFLAAGGPFFYGVGRDSTGVYTVQRYRVVERMPSSARR